MGHGAAGGGQSGVAGAVVGCLVAVVVVLGGFLALGVGFVWFAAGMGDHVYADDDDPRPAYRLDGVAVRVTPTDGLAEGDRVVVASDALPPGRIVEVVPCLLDDGAVDRCDGDQGARHAVPADGRLEVELAVPRVLTLGVEAVDCAAPDVECAVLAAVVDDIDTSGGAPVRFRADAPPLVPEPAPDPVPLSPGVATIEPPGPVGTGRWVTVTATGFEPGEPVRFGACPSVPKVEGQLGCAPLEPDDFLDRHLDAVPTEGPFADADGVARADVYLTAIVDGRGESGDVDCGPSGGCALVVIAAVDARRFAVAEVTVDG